MTTVDLLDIPILSIQKKEPSTEIKLLLSCLYVESIFFAPFTKYSQHSFILTGFLLNNSEEIFSLVKEIIKKNPEWFDPNILINNHYVSINGIPCKYLRENIFNIEYRTFIEKQTSLDWNNIVINPKTFITREIKFDIDDPFLLIMMLNYFNK